MSGSYVSIWLPYLKTDWLIKRNPFLINKAFVTAVKHSGRMIITSCNLIAAKAGIYAGMVLADARAICPGVEMIEDEEGVENRILTAMAQWCIRFTPITAVDDTDGIILEASGCYHLWGGEIKYLQEIKNRFYQLGYQINIAMASSRAAAWAMARYRADQSVTKEEALINVLQKLPAAALKLDELIIEKLQISGLYTIGHFINMPASALRRRFGNHLVQRLSQALGKEPEWIHSIEPVEEYLERLPCLEPIFTATAIEIAIEQLLDRICKRLKKENKGLRYVILKCYRVDNKVIEIPIGTSSATNNNIHLFKLFQLKIETIAPGFGIELFTLTATKVQELKTVQDVLWYSSKDGFDQQLSELIDRIKIKVPQINIYRFIPQEHYWPERSFKAVNYFNNKTSENWNNTKPRPTQLLDKPQPILVTAPVPDYPPMFFKYKGHLHKIAKADGPERIEPEWWISEGEHRDYYYVEDEKGKRYWIFRLGHYEPRQNYQWFLHGIFA